MATPMLLDATACRRLAVALYAIASAAHAQVPGEDTVPLQRGLLIQMQPLPGPAQSRAPNLANSMPDWMRARMSRYEAKAWSENSGTVMTERDVINTVDTQGLKSTCTQSVGSTVVPKGSTITKDTVVVLRGDLVNICR